VLNEKSLERVKRTREVEEKMDRVKNRNIEVFER